MFYWFMKNVVAGPIVWVLLRPIVRGMGHIPRRGPVIMAGNHLSFVDPVILPLVMRRRIHFLAASTYFAKGGVGGRLLAWFLRQTGMVPVDRTGGSASAASLQAGLSVLGRGAVLGIYPEGSRSRDGRLHRGRTGVARLALESGATVVPVAMVGTDRVIPVGEGSLIPRLQRVTVLVGEPVDLGDLTGRRDDPAVLRTVTDRIMRALEELGGQEYVDTYTGSAPPSSASPNSV